jgi:hypothetical protein
MDAKGEKREGDNHESHEYTRMGERGRRGTTKGANGPTFAKALWWARREWGREREIRQFIQD